MRQLQLKERFSEVNGNDDVKTKKERHHFLDNGTSKMLYY